MNAPLTTRLAPPRRLLAADVMFLVENGLINPAAKFELMDGEIVPMSPKGRFHEAMREILEEWLERPWARAFRIIREHTLTLDDQTLAEPDFIVYDRAARLQDRPLTGADIKLAIEVADKSWTYDTEEKPPKYAAFGLLEYWVVHAKKKTARIHRGPGPEGWADVRDIRAGETFAALCAPDSPLRL